MAHDHDNFDCKICGEHFHSKQELDRHNKDEHTQEASGGIGLAIAIMAGYLVVHYVALAFARADLLPPLIAAWSANVIFMGIGASLLLRART